MIDASGVLFALLAALFWGSYLVPMKRIKTYDPYFFQLLMAGAIVISSVAVSVLIGKVSFSALAALSGLLWSAGNITSILAVKKAALAKVIPVAAGTVIGTSFLWGVLFLREPLSNHLLAVLGATSLIAGITLAATTQKANSSKGDKTALLWAFIAGLFFGSYIVPFRLSGIETLSSLIPISIGVLAGALAIFAIKKPPIDRRITKSGAIAGLLWNGGNLASLFAVEHLGVAIGFPLTQLNIFVGVSWGLLYFREIKGRGEVAKIAVGALVVFLGAVLLTLSK